MDLGNSYLQHYWATCEQTTIVHRLVKSVHEYSNWSLFSIFLVPVTRRRKGCEGKMLRIQICKSSWYFLRCSYLKFKNKLSVSPTVETQFLKGLAKISDKIRKVNFTLKGNHSTFNLFHEFAFHFPSQKLDFLLVLLWFYRGLNFCLRWIQPSEIWVFSFYSKCFDFEQKISLQFSHNKKSPIWIPKKPVKYAQLHYKVQPSLLTAEIGKKFLLHICQNEKKWASNF